MRKPMTCLALGLSLWSGRGLPLEAAETPAPPIVPPAEAPAGAPAEAPAPEEKPVDPVADITARFHALAAEHPLLATTPLPAQWQALLVEAAAAQVAVKGAMDAPASERTELQIGLDDRLQRLDQLATSAEVTADGLEIAAQLDAHQQLPGIDGQRKLVEAARARVDAALSAVHEGQRSAQRKRQDGDRLQAQAEGLDQQVEAANHVVERLNDEFGKLDEHLDAPARLAQRTAIRARIAAAVVGVHALQRQALHARQQGELLGLAADALDDQAEAADAALDHERAAFGTAIEAATGFIDQGGAPPADTKKKGADDLLSVSPPAPRSPSASPRTRWSARPGTAASTGRGWRAASGPAGATLRPGLITPPPRPASSIGRFSRAVGVAVGRARRPTSPCCCRAGCRRSPP